MFEAKFIQLVPLLEKNDLKKLVIADLRTDLLLRAVSAPTRASRRRKGSSHVLHAGPAVLLFERAEQRVIVEPIFMTSAK